MTDDEVETHNNWRFAILFMLAMFCAGCALMILLIILFG